LPLLRRFLISTWIGFRFWHSPLGAPSPCEKSGLMDAVQDALAGSDRISLAHVSTASIEPLIERIEAIGITVEVETEAPTIAREENEHQQDVER
jgi:hypothetical protein